MHAHFSMWTRSSLEVPPSGLQPGFGEAVVKAEASRAGSSAAGRVTTRAWLPHKVQGSTRESRSPLRLTSFGRKLAHAQTGRETASRASPQAVDWTTRRRTLSWLPDIFTGAGARRRLSQPPGFRTLDASAEPSRARTQDGHADSNARSRSGVRPRTRLCWPVPERFCHSWTSALSESAERDRPLGGTAHASAPRLSSTSATTRSLRPAHRNVAVQLGGCRVVVIGAHHAAFLPSLMASPLWRQHRRPTTATSSSDLLTCSAPGCSSSA
jgi:hypothetical protein